MIALILLLFGISLFFAWRYPPVVAVIYAMINVGGDGFGVYGYGATLNLGTYLSLFRISLILASVFAFRNIVKSRQDFKNVRFALGLLMLVSTIWIGLGSVVKESDWYSIPGYMVYPGFAGGLIALAYIHELTARRLFTSLVIVQLFISALILIFPGTRFGELSAVNYLGREDMMEVQEELSGFARISKDERLYAQFNNPNTFGLYAVIGIILSFRLLFQKTKLSFFFGLILLVLGVGAWTQTLTRSVTAGALVGAIIAVVFSDGKIAIKVAAFLSFTLLLISFAFFDFFQSFIAVYSQAAQDTSLVSRMEAITEGMDVIIAWPIFGAVLDYRWSNGITPHQLPIYLAATYGLLVGVMGAGLLVMPIIGWIKFFKIKNQEKGSSHDFTAIVMFLTILAISVANNFAAPSLFWIAWAFGISPLLQLDKGSKTEAAASPQMADEIDSELPSLHLPRLQN